MTILFLKILLQFGFIPKIFILLIFKKKKIISKKNFFFYHKQLFCFIIFSRRDRIFLL